MWLTGRRGHARVRPTAALLASAWRVVWPVLAFTVAPDAMEGAEHPGLRRAGGDPRGRGRHDPVEHRPAWTRVSDLVGRSGHGLAMGVGLPMRLGLAYPLARRFRTSLLLGMYALVMFTLTFLAVFAGIFASQEHDFLRDVRAGTDIVVDSNPANPVSAATLRSQPDVADVASLLRAGPEFTARIQPTPTRWALTGFDASFLRHGYPSLGSHLPRFADDRATWEAVLHDPSLGRRERRLPAPRRRHPAARASASATRSPLATRRPARRRRSSSPG